MDMIQKLLRFLCTMFPHSPYWWMIFRVYWGPPTPWTKWYPVLLWRIFTPMTDGTLEWAIYGYIGIKHTTSSIRSSFQWTVFLIFHFSTINLPEIWIFLIAANLFSAPAYFFVMIFLKLMFKKTHFPLKILPASINHLSVFDRPRNWLPGSRSGFQWQGGDVFTGACYAKETLWFQRCFSVSCWLLMKVYYAENEECDLSRYPKVKCYQWLSRWWFQRDSGFLILQKGAKDVTVDSFVVSPTSE